MKNFCLVIASLLIATPVAAQDINVIIIGFGNTVTVEVEDEADEASGLWFDEHDSGTLLSYRGIRCRERIQTVSCGWETICIKCWGCSGRYFIDGNGIRWDVEGDPIPREDRIKMLVGSLSGRRFSAVFHCRATGEPKFSRSFIRSE